VIDPRRPIRIIVPGSRGGPGNIIAATVGERLSTTLHCAVEIAPAASQIAGLLEAARAEPDGHTLVMGGGSFYLSASLYRTLPFDPRKDFAAVNLVASIANVLVVHPSVPVQSIPEFIAYAKAHPGKLRYGSSGYGGPPHIAGALFCKMTGIDMLHVAYKGHVQAGNDLAKGIDLQVMFDAVPTALPHIAHGALRGLGVTTRGRVSVLPDLPTIAEAGLPGYEMNPAMGMLAPAGTSEDVLDLVAEAVGRITAAAEVRAYFDSLGIEAISSTRSGFAGYMRGQFDRWGNALDQAGISQVNGPA